VHRLDDGTSGCLVVAKSRRAARALGEAFRRRRVSKLYVALTGARAPKQKAGAVRGDMRAARRSARRLDRTCTRGRCACTDLRSVGLGEVPTTRNGASAASDADDDPRSTAADDGAADHLHVAARRLFVARPYTGRTHQIRCALKAISAPILGDSLYGGAPADRLYLHAAGLRFDVGLRLGEGSVGDDEDQQHIWWSASTDHASRGGPVTVVSKPTAGEAFCSPRFDAAWAKFDWHDLLATWDASPVCADHPALRGETIP